MLHLLMVNIQYSLSTALRSRTTYKLAIQVKSASGTGWVGAFLGDQFSRNSWFPVSPAVVSCPAGYEAPGLLRPGRVGNIWKF